MVANFPLVSVIMNCYNGEEFLNTAVDSVLAQSYQNWELIFWDNQSSDNSAKVFSAHCDTRLKYFLAPDHTLLYEARNYAVQKSKGEYLAFLDVDDWWDPSKLEKQISFFQDPKVGMLCSKYWIVNKIDNSKKISSTNPIPSGWVLNSLLKKYQVGLSTLVIRRSAFSSLHNGFDPKLHVTGDFDIVLRLARKWKMISLQEPLVCYLLHGGNVSQSEKGKQVEEYHYWLKKMSQYPDVVMLSGFRAVKNEYSYMKARLYLNEKSYKEAWRILFKMSWQKYKFKLAYFLLKSYL